MVRNSSNKEQETEFLKVLEGKESHEIAVSEYRELLGCYQDWNHQKKRHLASRAQKVLQRVHPHIQHQLGIRNQG